MPTQTYANAYEVTLNAGVYRITDDPNIGTGGNTNPIDTGSLTLTDDGGDGTLINGDTFNGGAGTYIGTGTVAGVNGFIVEIGGSYFH